MPESEHARIMGREVVVNSVDGKRPAPRNRNGQDEEATRRAVLREILSMILVVVGVVGVFWVAYASVGILGVIACVSALCIGVGLLVGRS